MRVKQQILELRSEGKTYNQIKDILGCSKGTISYHCGDGQKEKYKETRKRNSGTHIVSNKIDSFYKKQLKFADKTLFFQRGFGDNSKRRNGKYVKTFNCKDVIEKFGKKTQCYLTGRTIDLYEPNTYHFDHKVPCSKGGDSTIDNLGITCKEANMAKSNMLLEDFFNLCKEVLEHNGYKVDKI